MADGKYLDAQTFIHIIVQALQENKVPLRWRTFEFRQFNNLVKQFKIEPLGKQSYNQNIYSSRDHDDSNKQGQREFVDWRRALSSFLLMTVDWTYFNQNLNELNDKLHSFSDERQQLSIDTFVQVSFKSTLMIIFRLNKTSITQMTWQISNIPY